MKREIKFRVWAACDNGVKMIYLDRVECDNGLWFGADEHIDDYKDSIMQFTGLKDKNGRHIYEGDIVKVYDWEIREVKFRNAFWMLELREATVLGGFGTPIDAGHKPLYRYSEKWIEVVGNIYENQELLSNEPKPTPSATP